MIQKETLVLALFSAVLIGCVAAELPILLALAVGYGIFFAYAAGRGFAFRSILKMSAHGALKAKNILISFLLIGMLTALWRAAGTIPVVVCFAADFLRPSVMLLMAFLLNCLVSFLTGTAFGTAATMGVICMTMAQAMGCSPVLTGGAILSGVYFGDRMSPVSTSALLVAELTGTNIFDNIRLMFASALIPFAASCVFYTAAGFLSPTTPAAGMDIRALFLGAFRLGLLPVLPAAVILLLSLFRVPVKRAMSASILTAVLVCLFWQNITPPALIRLLFFGFLSPDPALAPMINGGGIQSMLNVGAIICISSSFSGIFEGTGLLTHLKETAASLGRRTSPFAAALLASVAASAVACNQTLAILLTHQVCANAEPDRQRFALFLENTAVVTAPLIPWSIACAVPLDSAGAPSAAVLAACYLYLLPLWRLLVQGRRTHDVPAAG